MTTERAIEILEDYQSQIIHGKTTFREIANLIRNLNEKMEAQVSAVVLTIGGEVDGDPTSAVNYLQRLRNMADEIAVLRLKLGAYVAAIDAEQDKRLGLPNRDQPKARKGWRLLAMRDAICQTDEILSDDCETWEPLPPNCPFVGLRYDGGLFVPMRRKVA